MTGKQKCKILKEIRRQIAEQNDIRYVIEECTHKGKCRGTCPKCEWEVQMLERELEKRRVSGKKVVLAGISAGFLLTSCSPVDTVMELVSSITNPLQGDMMAETTSGAITETATEGDIILESLEGEPAVPEAEIEEGEAEPVEVAVTEGILPAVNDTEYCENEEEIEEVLIAGEILPVEVPIEKPVLEGDLVFEGDLIDPVLEEGELP